VIISCDVLVEWSDLHLREFERVIVTLPVAPVDTVSGRIVAVETIQVAMFTVVEPPGTTIIRGARHPRIVVVMVSGAELLSQMVYHRVAFKQQHVYKLNCIVT